MTKAIYVLFMVTGKIRKEIFRTDVLGEAERQKTILSMAGLDIELDPIMVSA